MVSLKQKSQSGFTIVELLIVIVIIGILAGLVVTQFVNANQSARDSERKTDLNSLASQLEVYNGRAGGYPTLANMNDPAWRKANELSAGDNGKAMIDPQGASVTDLQAAPTKQRYSYQPLDSTGANCTSGMTDVTGEAVDPAPASPCTNYTLTAYLENKNDKSGVASGTDWVYVKKDGK